MSYCHDKGIVHQDLKPENIVMGGRGNTKRIDFGFNTRFTSGQKLNEFWGTVSHFAPELVLRQAYEDPPIGHVKPGCHSVFYVYREAPIYGAH